MTTRDDEQRQVRNIMAALVAYLEKNPNASDTLEGISKWWLSEAVPHSRVHLSSALDELSAQGRIECQAAANGQRVFRRRHAV